MNTPVLSYGRAQLRVGENNRFGLLGDESLKISSVPIMVAHLTNVVALAAGSLHTCALRADSTVYCWGHNVFGRLGNGSREDSARPVMAAGIAMATAIGAGGAFTCALLKDGQVWCWGSNGAGQLGNNTREDSLEPVRASGLSMAARQVAVGYDFACALIGEKSVSCWGSNIFSDPKRSRFFSEIIEIK